MIGLAIFIVEMLGAGIKPVNMTLGEYIRTVILTVTVFVAVIFAIKLNAFGIHRLFQFVYMIPKLGPALQTFALARVCWTLSLTLDSGLDALRSVKMSLKATQNDHFASRADIAVETIKSGGSMCDAYTKTGVFPDEFLQYVEMAEMSGSDAESLDHMAKMYDERAKMALSVISSFFKFGVWAAIAIFLISIILGMAMQLQGITQDALDFANNPNGR